MDDSWLGDFILAFGPWLTVLVCGLWLYAGVRLYRRTRVMSARAGAYLIDAVGFGIVGIVEFSGLHSKQLRMALAIISLLCMLVTAVHLTRGDSDLAPKRPV